MPVRDTKCVPTLSDLNSYYNNFKGFRIRARKYRNRGIGLEATEDIPSGRVIAYYRVKSVPSDTNRKCGPYVVNLGNKRDGILEDSHIFGTYRNIPYVGPFVNEPPPGKEENVYFEEASPTNIIGYRDMKFISKRFIKKGEEILWCYGESYGKRSYKTSCSS